MKKLTLTLVMLLGVATAGRAQAQYPAAVVDRPGFDLGLRLGYAVPFGDIDATPGNGLANGVSGGVPFILEAGYRFNSAVTVGLLFQYAFVGINNNATTGCVPANNCSGSVIRLGPEVMYHFVMPTMFVPWVGAGFGYEWFSLDSTDNNGPRTDGFSGFEFLNLQVGADYRAAPRFVIGPFASFSIARYSTNTADVPGASTSVDIADPAVHEWLQIGVRGGFNL
jgi:outer membrane protein W